MYLLMRIGCIECGVSSSVVAVYSDQEQAEKLASALNNNEKASWLEGGQNFYEVHRLPGGEFVTEEYLQMVKGEA